MIQVLFESQKIKVLAFFHCLTRARSIGKFYFIKISWLQNDSKIAKNIDQIKKDSWHRSIQKMQSFMGERYPLDIFSHGTENFSICLKIGVV